MSYDYISFLGNTVDVRMRPLHRNSADVAPYFHWLPVPQYAEPALVPNKLEGLEIMERDAFAGPVRNSAVVSYGDIIKVCHDVTFAEVFRGVAGRVNLSKWEGEGVRAASQLCEL